MAGGAAVVSIAGDRRVRVVGRGRAGGSFAAALAATGWTVDHVAGRSPAIESNDVGLVLVCVPDEAIVEVAERISPSGATIAHVAGSLGVDVLAGHRRRAVLHPLASLPDPTVGGARLRDGITFAIAGDAMVAEVVASLGGTAVVVDETQRSAYHAAAVIASNHLVALVDQAERVARSVGLPAEMYRPLIRQTLDNIERMGPAAALTGPAARGDRTTLDRHRQLLAEDPFGSPDVVAYDALATLCHRLAATR